MPVDILPGCGRNVAKTVGSETHNLTILPVKSIYPLNRLPSHEPKDISPFREGSVAGSWEFRQWVEEKSINQAREDIGNSLEPIR